MHIYRYKYMYVYMHKHVKKKVKIKKACLHSINWIKISRLIFFEIFPLLV